MTSFKAKKILITGGAGFIGSEFVRQGVEKGYDIVVVDKLTYAGSLERLEPVKGKYKFYKSDICDNAEIDSIFDKEKPEAVVHFAAETHVDRSISGPGEFVRTNVLGTYVMLEAAKKQEVGKFVHVSTDEVYGSLGEDDAPFTEETPLAPNSPYSASKASSDFLARAYYKTFGLPIIITRCSNNYGPYQYAEKLIPLMITNALANKSLPVYGNGRNVRDWIYVKDHCAAVYAALNKGKNGEVYNIGGSNEWTNIDIVEKICKILDDTVPLPGSSKSYKSLITFVKDRLGHDWRYAIDSGKIIRELGWKPETDFEKGIEATVRWYSSADIRDKI